MDYIMNGADKICLHSNVQNDHLLLRVSKAASMAVAKFSASSLLAKLSPYTCFKSRH